MAKGQTLALGAAATVLLVFTDLSGAGAAVAAPCRVHSDTSELAAYFIKQILADNDSAAILALGLPFNPGTTSIVADSATCHAVIRGYNAHLPATDSVLRVTSGYVVSVSAGTAFGLYIPGTPAGPYKTESFALFNAAFQFRFKQVAIQ